MRKNIISFLGTVFIEEVLFSSLTFSQFQGFSNFQKKKKIGNIEFQTQII